MAVPSGETVGSRFEPGAVDTGDSLATCNVKAAGGGVRTAHQTADAASRTTAAAASTMTTRDGPWAAPSERSLDATSAADKLRFAGSLSSSAAMSVSSSRLLAGR